MAVWLHRFPQNPLYSIFIALVILFLLSSFHTPNPTSPSFQFPSTLPSRYPPTRSSDPQLTAQLQILQDNLTTICPGPNEAIHLQPGLTTSQEKRYGHLRKQRGKYMLVTTIRQIQSQLPDLLNTVLVLATYLGPEKIAFSVLEGPSDDCTSSALELVLVPLLHSLGVPENAIWIRTREPSIDFNQHNRIEVLAELRNRAFSPLWDDPIGKEVIAVVAFNDVYLQASDVLELLHQHVKAGEKSGLEIGITTGMDYLERWPEWYYDIWVGRTVRRNKHRNQKPIERFFALHRCAPCVFCDSPAVHRSIPATCSIPSPHHGGPQQIISSPNPHLHSRNIARSNPFKYIHHGMV